MESSVFNPEEYVPVERLVGSEELFDASMLVKGKWGDSMDDEEGDMLEKMKKDDEVFMEKWKGGGRRVSQDACYLRPLPPLQPGCLEHPPPTSISPKSRSPSSKPSDPVRPDVPGLSRMSGSGEEKEAVNGWHEVTKHLRQAQHVHPRSSYNYSQYSGSSSARGNGGRGRDNRRRGGYHAKRYSQGYQVNRADSPVNSTNLDLDTLHPEAIHNAQMKQEFHDILNCFQTSYEDPGDWFVGEGLKDPREANIRSYFHEIRDQAFSCRNARRLIGNVTQPVSEECREYFGRLKGILGNVVDKIDKVLQ